MQRTKMTEAEQMATIAEFLPLLLEHIHDSGWKMTTSGFTITPEWAGLTVTAYCVDEDLNDERMQFTADEAADFLAEIDC